MISRLGGFVGAGRESKTIPAKARAAAAAAAAAARPFTAVETLEERRLLAATLTPETLVNVSRLRGNQTEGTIAINPLNPSQLFAASNNGEGAGAESPDTGGVDPLPTSVGLFAGTSNDAGVTWTSRNMATGGAGGDGLPAACCDASVEFDSFGNLYLTYLGSDLGTVSGGFDVILALSTDGGATFTEIGNFGRGDQPTVTTGPGTVWVTWEQGGMIHANGAPVTGPGAAGVGAFIGKYAVGGSESGQFGDIAVGPQGQVMVTYQRDLSTTVGQEGPSDIWTHVDPDGLGPQGFGPGTRATYTNVGGFDFIPAQNRRSIDAEANLEYDRSGGPRNGRAYLVYTNERGRESLTGNNADTDVFIRFSDDNGVTWTGPSQVNDDPDLGSTARGQFLPQVAVDQTTGNVAVGFHDARNDTAADGDVNDDVQYYAAVGVPTSDGNGINFTPNARIGAGQSDAKRADSGIDFGDYTGLAFHNNVLYPAFADNSNITGDNPEGRLRRFDLYTGRAVFNPNAPSLTPPQVTPNSPLAPTLARGREVVKAGRFYNFTVRFTSPAGIDASTIGTGDFVVTGPNGFREDAQLVRARARGTTAQASYRIAGPGGEFDRRFDAGDNGLYFVSLLADAVRATDGTATQAGTLTTFLVNVRQPRRGRTFIQATVQPPAPATLFAAPSTTPITGVWSDSDEAERGAAGVLD
jgi:hypothetical protein